LIHLYVISPDDVIEGKIGSGGKNMKRPKQLLDDLEEKRRYWKLKEEVFIE
jgi:hypothetical protein